MNTATFRRPLKMIDTPAAYRAARQRLDELLTAAEGTPEFDELGVLGMLISHYEDTAFPIAKPTLAEAIEFSIERLGLDRSVLTTIFGTSSRAGEVMRGERALSKEHMKGLIHHLRMPAELVFSYAGAHHPRTRASHRQRR